MDYDDSKIDDDLDKLLQHIKEDQQNSMDAPDSPKEDALTGHGGHESLDSKMPSSHSRHLLYTTHFPLPQVMFFEYFTTDHTNDSLIIEFFVKIVDARLCRTRRVVSTTVTNDMCYCMALDVSETRLGIR